jgi:ABC-2 type transport system ATP-binding protein
VIFLDEPTAGVDPVARRIFWRLIRELSHQGTTIFVTTHYLDEAEYCRRVGLMVSGRLVALDTPAALKKTWVPGRVVVARGRGLAGALPVLRREQGILAIEPFGAGLHLQVVPDRWDAPALAAALGAAGATEVQVEEAEASLEDVFLAVVGKTEQGGASDPT